MQHTSGPWAAVGWSRGRDASLVTSGGHAIAGAYYLGGTDPANANARLIAAAPDLLKELKWVAGRIDRTSGSPSFTSDEYDRILAAIAKAEGQS